MITNTRTLASWLTAVRPLRYMWPALVAGLLTIGAQDANAAKTNTTTTLTASPTTTGIGEAVTLTATVSPSKATGTVTFKDGTTTIGTASLSAGVASVIKSFSSAGAHSLTAVYGGTNGNNGFNSSTSAAVTETVIAKANTTTTLSAAPNPSTAGQAVALTASVVGNGPTGAVTFKDGATTLGTGTISAGAASFSTSALAVGSHSLSASYVGDANNTASNSAPVAQTVTAPAVPLPPPPNSPMPVVNYEYDAQGNPTRTVQAPGVSGFNFATQSSYDALNRRKDTTDARSGVTQFGYDGLDRTTSITDPRSLVTQTPRNGLGDATQLVSPDTGSAGQTYDAAGNLSTRTDSRGVLASYSHDALNRQTGIVYTQSGQPTLSHAWSYDQVGAGFSNGIGRLTSTTHPGGSTQYAYDPQGRLLTDTQRVNAATGANAAQLSTSVGYAYDAGGNVSGITYPSGRKLSITYSGGKPSAMALAKDGASTAAPLIGQIQFSPFGGPLSWQWQMAGSTQAYARVYDTAGRLVRYRLGNTARDLTYDAGDRITAYTHYDATTAVAIPALDQSFGYDELGRLTTITTATASWSIGYDANGNRTGVTLNASTSTYTTSSTSNRLNTITNPARSFGYDNAGNTTSDSAGYTSTYDLIGRLSTLTKAGVTSTYTYDGLGRRVRKFAGTGASSTIVFVYDQGGQLLGEYSATGAAIREYVWLGSTPVAMFTPDAVATNPPLVYYIHTDHLDTPRVVVDRNNNLRWRWLAEPFGTTAPETNPQSLGAFTQNLRFPGQYADIESGLSYNFFRDYDASTGRYVQSDPIGLAGGVSTFSYVGSNPLSFTDPEGLQVLPLPPPPIIPPPVVPNPDYPYTPAPPSFHWPNLLPQPWVDKIIQMCSDTPEQCRQKCDAANKEQIRICKIAPTRRAREACYSRANDLYGQCLKACK